MADFSHISNLQVQNLGESTWYASFKSSFCLAFVRNIFWLISAVLLEVSYTTIGSGKLYRRWLFLDVIPNMPPSESLTEVTFQ